MLSLAAIGMYLRSSPNEGNANCVADSIIYTDTWEFRSRMSPYYLRPSCKSWDQDDLMLLGGKSQGRTGSVVPYEAATNI